MFFFRIRRTVHQIARAPGTQAAVTILGFDHHPGAVGGLDQITNLGSTRPILNPGRYFIDV